MIDDIRRSDFAEISLIVLHDSGTDTTEQRQSVLAKILRHRTRIFGILLRKLMESVYARVVERNTYVPDALATIDMSTALDGIPTIRVRTEDRGISQYFPRSALDAIEAHDLDVLFRGGFGILRGEILDTPHCGVWSFHHGDNRVNRGGPPGYWESMENWPQTGAILQILTEDLDNGRVLARTWSSTDSLSLKDSRSKLYWKTRLILCRKLEELHRVGTERFLQKVAEENRNPEFYSRRLYRQPTAGQFARHTLRKVVQKVGVVARQRLWLDQWILLISLRNDLSTSLWRYRKVVPPKDRFWADPFPVRRGDRYFIFLEEFLYATSRAHISVMEVDERGEWTRPRIVLERPYHLSYPCVFEHDGQLWMVPESAANRTVELYRCVQFPDRWEHVMNLMEGVTAVDATLYCKDGRWWMFVNMSQGEGVSTWDELFLFSSDRLQSADWAPHPLNPVVSDCRTARPAGHLFEADGRIYRPSQDSSHYYGYGFNLMEVESLTPSDYRESVVSQVRPDWDRDIVATHTFNRAGRLHVIDGIYRRRR